MPLVRIDASRIRSWDDFHNVFAEALGFPDFYGRTMDAWIDCMSSLDDPDDRLTTLHGSSTDPVVLRLDNANSLLAEHFSTLVECAGFVNWRNLEIGDPVILILAFDRAPAAACPRPRP